MKLKARVLWWKALQNVTKKEKQPKNKVVESAISYYNDERFQEVESDSLSTWELERLKEVVQPYLKKEFPARDLVSKINAIFELYQQPEGQKIMRLEAIVDAVRAYIGPKPRRWVYLEEDDGTMCAYFVKDVIYTPQRVETHKYGGRTVRTVYPPYTTLHMSALDRENEVARSHSWYKEDLSPPRTISEHLNEAQIFVETPKFAEQYDAQIARYRDVSSKLGAQYQATGVGYFQKGDRWYSSDVMMSMVRDGYATKVIVDDNEEDETDRSSRKSSRSESDEVSNRFWKNYDLALLGKHTGRVEGQDTDDEEDDDELAAQTVAEDVLVELTDEERALLDKVRPPVHPYLRCFDLDKHEFLYIHIDYIDDYPWDASLVDKLILPKTTKELVQLLVSGTKENKEDIIRGKMGGVIVIATGPPGTGKTLTAEVFSETIQRPLYTIQCAQLGTDADSIETKLQLILRRAQRWQAILLIDEADVYIRSRGDDIEQNAIVGVFLRVLEYYRGVMFMTSNRETLIDDAIMSRATAWIRYFIPDEAELRDLWRVLSANYDVKLTAKDIDALMKHLPKLSGRCVRNLIRLARKTVGENSKQKITEKTLRSVAQFQYLPHHTDQELRDAAKGGN